MSTPARIILQLRIRVKPEKRTAFIEFLREARPFYESPGNISMRLLQDRSDPTSYLEVFEYQTLEAFEADELRVQHDAKMHAYLTRWREFLEAPPVVEVYVEQTIAIR